MSAESVAGALSRVKLANPLWDIQRASIGAGFTATRDERHLWQPTIALLEAWLSMHGSRRPPPPPAHAPHYQPPIPGGTRPCLMPAAAAQPRLMPPASPA